MTGRPQPGVARAGPLPSRPDTSNSPGLRQTETTTDSHTVTREGDGSAAATSNYQVMPPLSAEEYTALRADIAVHGIRVPIDVDEDGNILDGHHRAAISAELGIDCPTRLVAGLSEDQKHHHALAVNTTRRTLTREQRHALIRAELERDPHRSDRALGRWLGVDGKTVGAIRHEMDAEKHAAERAREQARVEACDYLRKRVEYARDERPAWVAWAYAHAPESTAQLLKVGPAAEPYLAELAVSIHLSTGCDLDCPHPRPDLTHAEFPHAGLEQLLAEPDYTPYTVHPYLAMFPLVPADQFAAICADIARVGLIHPITLNHEQTVIVDGRIRFLACRETGVEPRFEVLGADYDDEKMHGYIQSMNVERMHMPRLHRLIGDAIVSESQ